MTGAERRQRAKIDARTRWSQHDSAEHAAKMRTSRPSSDQYWLDKVDPDGELHPAERKRRASYAKRAHFARRRREQSGEVAS